MVQRKRFAVRSERGITLFSSLDVPLSRTLPAHPNHRWLRNLPLDKSGQHFNAGVLSLADRVSLMEWSVLTQVRRAVVSEVLLFERSCGCMVVSDCGCQWGKPLSTRPSPTLFHYIYEPRYVCPLFFFGERQRSCGAHRVYFGKSTATMSAVKMTRQKTGECI